MSGASAIPGPAGRPARRPATLRALLDGVLAPDAVRPVAVGAGQGGQGGANGAGLDVAVSGLTLDSRDVRAGDLYLALPGRATHGLDHAADAVARGAVAVATVPGALEARPDAAAALRAARDPDGRAPTVVEARGLAGVVGALASRCFGEPDRDLRLVAVTGTDGKTSVCRFVASALAALGTRAGYVGTIGWGVVAAPGKGGATDGGRGDGLADGLASSALTTPDVVALRRMLAELRDAGCEAVALEASSHGIAEGRLDGLALDVAVLTNLGHDHLDYHGTVEAYGAAKARLFDFPGLGAAVLNADDALGAELVARLRRRAASGAPAPAVATFGTRVGGPSIPAPVGASADPTYAAVGVAASPRGLDFELLDGATRTAVSSPLLGRFNVDNLLACHGALRALGVGAADAAGALGALRPVRGRMERVAPAAHAAPPAGPTAIVDFAHTPDALGAAIGAVRAHCPGRLHVVFGCGGDRDRAKRAPMARAAEAADRVVLTSDNPRTEDPQRIIADALEGIADRARVEVVPERRAAIERAIREAADDDVVLVAGKGHETHQIVGTVRHPFDDREVVAAALARRARGTASAVARPEAAA